MPAKKDGLSVRFVLGFFLALAFVMLLLVILGTYGKKPRANKITNDKLSVDEKISGEYFTPNDLPEELSGVVRMIHDPLFGRARKYLFDGGPFEWQRGNISFVRLRVVEKGTKNSFLFVSVSKDFITPATGSEVKVALVAHSTVTIDKKGENLLNVRRRFAYVILNE